MSPGEANWHKRVDGTAHLGRKYGSQRGRRDAYYLVRQPLHVDPGVPHLINRRITDHVCWRNWIYGPDLMLISGPDQAWITSDLCDWAQDQHLECALPGRLLLPRGPTAKPLWQSFVPSAFLVPEWQPQDC